MVELWKKENSSFSSHLSYSSCPAVDGWSMMDLGICSTQGGTKAPGHGIFPQLLSPLPGHIHCSFVPCSASLPPQLHCNKATELQGKSCLNPPLQAPDGSPCSSEHFMPSWWKGKQRGEHQWNQIRPITAPCSVTEAVNDAAAECFAFF